MRRRTFLWLAAAAPACLGQPADLEVRRWTVEGVEREALVHAPAGVKSSAAPLIFVFHGHGGNMNGAARSFHLHQVWPEAIVVYAQGLKCPGVLTDPAGMLPGWQSSAGTLDDRDLKLFDAMLADLRAAYRVDPKRIYATGHSNGGAFTYLLWAHRGDVLAAVAPSGAFARPADWTLLKPKPVLHIAGKNDRLVKFEWQVAMIEYLRKSNGSEPVETYIFDGGHMLPKDAPERIVAFFRAH